MESNNNEKKIYNTFEKEYYEFRIYLIGDNLVGKQSIINKISSLPSTRTFKPINNTTIEIKNNVYDPQIIKKRDKNNTISEKDEKTFSKETPSKSLTSSVLIQQNNINQYSNNYNEKDKEKYKIHPADNSAILYNINNTKLIFKPFFFV